MINAPELTPKDPGKMAYEQWCELPGAKSKLALVKKLGGLYMPDGKVIWSRDKVLLVATVKKEKYGRYLATIYDGDECINNWMVEQNFAVTYNG
jgi:endonuclease YncB( thermonuclease family)